MNTQKLHNAMQQKIKHTRFGCPEIWLNLVRPESTVIFNNNNYNMTHSPSLFTSEKMLKLDLMAK